MSDDGTTTTGAADTTTTAATDAITTTAAAPTVDWNAFIGKLDTLNEGLGGKLDTLVAEVKGAASQPEPQAPVDLEAMSRPELVTHIVGVISQVVQQQLKASLDPLHEQVQHVQTVVATGDVQRDVARMRDAHKDFNDWKDEMVALSKVHPTLNIPDLYGLARVNNPAKAGELDKKYTPPAPPPPPRWGGLIPAMSGNGAKPPLTHAQAGSEAYREVAARHPGVLRALEDL